MNKTTVGDIIKIMERLAPKNLAEPWDNPGLQIGSRQQKIRKIAITLDLTPPFATLAAKENCDLIITHHPFFFRPIKNLNTDGAVGKMVATLLKNDIALYSAHTNLDSARGGVNDCLAEALGLTDVKPFIPGTEKLLKIGVYVPDAHAEKMRHALAAAGAGNIGEYSDCSYSTQGVGRFRPLPGARPHIGAIGEIAAVSETRIEAVLPDTKKSAVIAAMLKAHPYETPAYDLFTLANDYQGQGLGRVGKLKTPLTLDEFALFVKNKLNAAYVRLVRPFDYRNEKKIKTLAFCGGAGADFLLDAAKVADAYLTGDVKYHEARKAQELNLPLIDGGHFPTENMIVGRLADYLRNELEEEIEIIVDETAKDPFEIAASLPQGDPYANEYEKLFGVPYICNHC